MNYLGNPYVVVPQYVWEPQQTAYYREIPSSVPATNQLIQPVQTFFQWVKILQEQGLSQEQIARAVRSMPVEETAEWIWTLSMQKGWCEAAYYARAFQDNAISGQNLEFLDDECLIQLSVANCFHRAIILRIIRWIFSSSSMIFPDARFCHQYQVASESSLSCPSTEVVTAGRNSEVMSSESRSLSAQMEESINRKYIRSGASSLDRRSVSNTELSQDDASEVEELVATSLRSRSLILK